ncbi:MAG: hypothetical protein R3C59_02555 [Planctomycetaceae bacterium]
MIHQTLDRLIDDLKSNIVSAASGGDSFDSAERATVRSVLQIGLQALQLFVALQGNGDLGAEVETADGKRLVRSECPRSTTLRSIFGTHDFRQFTYSPGKKRAIALRPVSARMSLPEVRWSFLLQEFSQMLGVDQAWEQATTNLGQIFGGRFSVDTAERINGRMGTSAGEFLRDLPRSGQRSEAAGGQRGLQRRAAGQGRQPSNCRFRNREKEPRQSADGHRQQCLQRRSACANTGRDHGRAVPG